MKKYKGLLLTIVLISKFGYSQTTDISLRGHIDTLITSFFSTKELIIKINESTNYMNLNQADVIKVPVNPDGSFKVNIKTQNSPKYLSFWIIENSNKIQTTTVNLPVTYPDRLRMNDECYLFEPGDNIDLQIIKGGFLYFKGKGSEKLNCQFQIYNVDPYPKPMSDRKTNLMNLNQCKDALSLEGKFLDQSIQMRLAILNSYKGKINDKDYKRIYLDVWASTEIPMLQALDEYYQLQPDFTNKELVKDFYNSYSEVRNASEVDSNYMAESAYYADFIFEKEFCTYKLFRAGSDYRTKGKIFIDIVEVIERKYHSELRDKLLFICYQRLAPKYPLQAKISVAKCISIMSTQKYIDQIKTWGNTQLKAYPFELEDAEGKIHKLSDYSGKVLVIDFWFTGCSACAHLNAVMEKIIEYYKDNKNLVFLTVSIDQNKQMWLKSISSGIYTSSKTINLYTNGMADQHPMIKYYNYVGAPQQLIIGKNGDLISSSPTRPDSGVEIQKDAKTGVYIVDQANSISGVAAKAFMKVINNNL